jgi:hypothetical protein
MLLLPLLRSILQKIGKTVVLPALPPVVALMIDIIVNCILNSANLSILSEGTVMLLESQ